MNKLIQVQQTPVDALIPFARNARTHSDEQVKQIAASIREFGFNNPILIRDDLTVIAGHGRLAAAKVLGLKEVPTISLAHLTPLQVRAYVLADNKLALNAGWDDEMLALELKDLDMEGFDVSLTGFDEVEIGALLADKTEEGLTDEDEVPEPLTEPLSRIGDVWVLGNHRVMCGDSTSIDAVNKLMNGKLASFVFTDPPWNVAYGTNLANNVQGYKQRTILNDSFDDPQKWADFLTATVSCLSLSTEPGCPIYCVMGPSEWPAVDKALRDGGFHWSSTIIWVKDSLVLSRKDYHTKYEPIWYGWKDGCARICEVVDRKQSDVWEHDRPKVSELHPTTKPIELIEKAINNSSKAGACVFEPFGGSGSTLIACEKTGRINRSMELDPKYCDVIVKRWQDFTGKKATLESNGKTFDELKAK